MHVKLCDFVTILYTLIFNMTRKKIIPSGIIFYITFYCVFKLSTVSVLLPFASVITILALYDVADVSPVNVYVLLNWLINVTFSLKEYASTGAVAFFI